MTDEQILAIAHRKATTYAHRSDPKDHSYGFVRHTLLDFAHAVTEAAVLAERERCATFVEHEYERQFTRPWREDLAAAIRGRGEG